MISIVNALIVNEGRVFKGNIKINGDQIVEVTESGAPFVEEGNVINANYSYVLPGVIDEHVHFREPGMEQKGDIYTESRAAAAGGVTTYFDMPNTRPQTTSLDALQHKQELARQKSFVNYAFFLGATNANISELQEVDARIIPGIKVFMGASTGNMLVNDNVALRNIFRAASRKNLPIVTHCEDSSIIKKNAERIKLLYGENAPVYFHSKIRDQEVCLSSTNDAISFANKCGAKLLIAHVSTAKELLRIEQSQADVRAEGCIGYLFFDEDDYLSKGPQIKCNPAVKTPADREALRQALRNKKIWSIATDHAPHLMSEKQGGAFSATSGIPSIQFSLVLMLSLTDSGVLDIQDIARLMCHNPATFFGVDKRGFIRESYKADLVIVTPTQEPHTITNTDVLSKCLWTPYEGMQTRWRVDATFCNGALIYSHDGGFIESTRHAQPITFNHDH